MKTSLAVSILVHVALLAMVWLAMGVPAPEKKSEPLKIRVLLPVPSQNEPAPLSDIKKELPPTKKTAQPRKPEPKLPQPKIKPSQTLQKAAKPTAEMSAAVETKPAEPSVRPSEPPVPPVAPKAAAMPKEIVRTKDPVEPLKPDPKVREVYLEYLRQAIDERKVYPRNAKRLGQTGVVMVKFTLLGDGAITNVSVAESSGFELLDRAASNLLKEIGKVRPVPKELGNESLTLTIPMEYTLR